MEAILVVCLNPTFQQTYVLDHLLEGEVNRCALYRLDIAGKGANTARIITQLGGTAIHLTHLGGRRKAEFLDMIKEDHIEVLWADSQSPIRTCTTIINRQKNTVTEVVEEPLSVGQGTEEAICALYSQALDRVATVVIAGTRAPGYRASLYPDFVREAKQAGKRVILDVKGDDLKESLPYRVDVIKPNLSEFTATFMPDLTVLEQQDAQEMKDQVASVLARLYNDFGTATVLTRGAYATWVYDGQAFHEIPTKPVEVVNTIGSGDAVTAGLAYELTRGREFNDAVDTALRCGRENARYLRPGTILPS